MAPLVVRGAGLAPPHAFRPCSDPMPVLVSLALAASLALAPFAARAQALLVDQENLAEWDGAWSISGLAPVGQTFIPTFQQMNVVVLDLGQDIGSPDSAAFAVRLWADSIGGTLLGVSDTVLLRVQSRAHVRFDIRPPAPLVPGVKTTLEVFRAWGTGNLMAYGNFLGFDDVREAILGGQRRANTCLWFRTGYDASVPVAPSSWGAIKRRWRGARPPDLGP